MYSVKRHRRRQHATGHAESAGPPMAVTMKRGKQKATGGVCACGFGSKVARVLSQAVLFGKRQAQYGKETAKPPPIRVRKMKFRIAISFSCASFFKDE